MRGKTASFRASWDHAKQGSDSEKRAEDTVVAIPPLVVKF